MYMHVLCTLLLVLCNYLFVGVVKGTTPWFVGVVVSDSSYCYDSHNVLLIHNIL